MSLDNSAVVPALPTGYDIDQSLKFNDDDNAYLTRSFSAGNRKTWTWSGWFKRGSRKISSSTYNHFLFGGISNTYGVFYRENPNNPSIEINVGNSGNIDTNTTIFLRDHSSWYHIVAVMDCTNATESERLRCYVNGVRLTSSDVDLMNMPSYNTDAPINQATTHWMGKQGGLGRYGDFYQAECHFVDGQALTADDFGEFDEDYGNWKPKRYTGSYGTTGFYLDFGGTYYNDKSGNGNNWTANNLSTYDVVLDSPTNNFCVLDPNNQMPYDAGDQATLSQGNLKLQGGTYGYTANGYHGTIGMNGGKWYWETVLDTDLGTSGAGGYYAGCHTHDLEGLFYDNQYRWENYSYYLYFNIQNNERRIKHYATGEGYNIDSAYGTGVAGDVQMFAVDLENGQMWFGKNGTWYNSQNPETGANCYIQSNELLDTNKTYLPFVAKYESGSHYIYVNFGQDSSFSGYKTSGSGNYSDSNGQGDFYYEPPSGYLALCTKNLPDPAVIPKENMNAITWSGNGTNPHAITGVGFKPDFVWTKAYSGTGRHWWAFNSVKGVYWRHQMASNNDGAGYSTDSLKSFDTDGFTFGAGGDFNQSGDSFVSYCWKGANGSVSNTDGNITSTVSANPDAGFSVVKYTANGTSGQTIGHGLNKAPEMIFAKDYDSNSSYTAVYNKDVTLGNTIFMNLTDGQQGDTNVWASSHPTSTYFKVNASAHTGQNGHEIIAYCFHSVEGVQKVGVWKGTGTTEGTFIYCGFRPKFIIAKKINSGESWEVRDGAREPYNETDSRLIANSTNTAAGGTNGDRLDILANGFKARDGAGQWNDNGHTYVFVAFAETPFKYTTAR